MSDKHSISRAQQVLLVKLVRLRGRGEWVKSKQHKRGDCTPQAKWNGGSITSPSTPSNIGRPTVPVQVLQLQVQHLFDL